METERNFAVNEKWLTARFESLYYKQTEIMQLRKNCLVRDLCSFMLTEKFRS